MRMPSSYELKNAIKLALGGFLAAITGQIIGHIAGRDELPLDGLWCLVSAILVIQERVGATYRAGRERFLGSLFGAVVGVAMASLLGSSPLVVAIALLLIALLCTSCGFPSAIRIAGMTAAIIILMAPNGSLGEIAYFSLLRLIDALVGIAIAVAMAHLLWKREAVEQSLLLLRSLWEQMALLCGCFPKKLSKQLLHQARREAAGLLEQVELLWVELEAERSRLDLKQLEELIEESRLAQGWLLAALDDYLESGYEERQQSVERGRCELQAIKERLEELVKRPISPVVPLEQVEVYCKGSGVSLRKELIGCRKASSSLFFAALDKLAHKVQKLGRETT